MTLFSSFNTLYKSCTLVALCQPVLSRTDGLCSLCLLLAEWPDWAIYFTLGKHSKPVATIILPKLLTLLGNFCKGVKVIHFSTSWNHFWATFIDAIFYWSHCWTKSMPAIDIGKRSKQFLQINCLISILAQEYNRHFRVFLRNLVRTVSFAFYRTRAVSAGGTNMAKKEKKKPCALILRLPTIPVSNLWCTKLGR